MKHKLLLLVIAALGFADAFNFWYIRKLDHMLSESRDSVVSCWKDFGTMNADLNGQIMKLEDVNARQRLECMGEK